MVSTGVASLDQLLGGDGYPDRSAILVVGPPGIGKEELGYCSGLIQGDYCLYATHRPASDVLCDMKGVGVPPDRVPGWIASSGPPVEVDLRDSVAISSNIETAARRNKGGRVKIATDVLSPLLVFSPLEPVYSYWSQLLADLKQQDSVVFALTEGGMHPSNAHTTMEQLFDGVIEMRLYEEGLAITPLFRARKMLGLPPLHDYFRFTGSNKGVEVLPRAR